MFEAGDLVQYQNRTSLVQSKIANLLGFKKYTIIEGVSGEQFVVHKHELQHITTTADWDSELICEPMEVAKSEADSEHDKENTERKPARHAQLSE